MHLSLIDVMRNKPGITQGHLAQELIQDRMSDFIEISWKQQGVLYAKILAFPNWNMINPIREAIHEALDKAPADKVGLVIDITGIRAIPKTMGMDLAVSNLRDAHPKLRMIVFVVSNPAIQTVLSGMVRMARASNRFLFETEVETAIALLQEPPPPQQ